MTPRFAIVFLMLLVEDDAVVDRIEKFACLKDIRERVLDYCKHGVLNYKHTYI